MQKCDIAVLGAGLGGLAVAALLSKKKKTIVFERNGPANTAVGKFEKDGFTFFAAPSLVPGFESHGAFQGILADLGIDPIAAEPAPCYQVVLPDRRITAYPDPDKTLTELGREFPHEINALRKFYRDILRVHAKNAKSRFTSFLARHRKAAGFIRTYRFSPELCAFFNVQSLLFFQRPLEDVSLAALISLCSSFPIRQRAGGLDLVEKLHRAIARHEGIFIRFDEACEIVRKGRRATGVRTAQGTVEAGKILLNTAPRIHPTTLFLGLREQVVPVGMCSDVICLPDYARPNEFFTLALGKAQEDAPSGMRTLTASFWQHQDSPADKRELVAQISMIMPFLDDYLIFVEEHNTDNKEVAVPADLPFTPLRSKDTAPLIFKTSLKNVYQLSHVVETPLQTLAASQQFVKKIS